MNDTSNNITYELRKLPQADYLCQVGRINSSDSTDNLKEEEKILMSKLDTFSQSLIEGLEDTCAFFLNSYWTYTFCNNSQLSQFHGGVKALANPNTYKYILGNAPTSNSNYTINKDQGIWHLSKIYDNGTICDLTGEPRTVEIQYICDPKAKRPNLFSVRELRTCHYLAQIAVPELCREDILRDRADPFVSEIQCKRVIKENYDLNHRGKISLMNYDLNYLGPDLFSGFPKSESAQSGGHSTIIIDIAIDPSTLVERFGDVYFNSLDQNKLVSPELSEKLRDQSVTYTFEANVYDSLGDYKTTLDISFEKLDPPMITVRSADFGRQSEIITNVKGLITLDQIGDKIVNEGQKA